MAKAYLGVTMPPPSEWVWETPNLALDEEQRKWMWKEGVELGLFRYAHVVKGAVLGVRALHRLGYDLSVVTQRPHNAMRDTLAWLAFMDLPFTEVHVLTNQQPKSSVPGDILVDDKPENIEDWSAHGRRAILFDQPWNSEFKWKERANGWEHLVRMLDTTDEEIRAKRLRDPEVKARVREIQEADERGDPEGPGIGAEELPGFLATIGKQTGEGSVGG